jgi:hypothetical protein
MRSDIKISEIRDSATQFNVDIYVQSVEPPLEFFQFCEFCGANRVAEFRIVEIFMSAPKYDNKSESQQPQQQASSSGNNTLPPISSFLDRPIAFSCYHTILVVVLALALPKKNSAAS